MTRLTAVPAKVDADVKTPDVVESDLKDLPTTKNETLEVHHHLLSSSSFSTSGAAETRRSAQLVSVHSRPSFRTQTPILV